MIPTIITQLANGFKQIKLGDVTPTKDLNFVKDTCKGFISIANAENVEGQVINIGSNFEVSVKDVFNTINKIMGANAEIVTDEIRLRPANSEVFFDYGVIMRKLKNLPGLNRIIHSKPD